MSLENRNFWRIINSSSFDQKRFEFLSTQTNIVQQNYKQEINNNQQDNNPLNKIYQDINEMTVLLNLQKNDQSIKIERDNQSAQEFNDFTQDFINYFYPQNYNFNQQQLLSQVEQQINDQQQQQLIHDDNQVSNNSNYSFYQSNHIINDSIVIKNESKIEQLEYNFAAVYENQEYESNDQTKEELQEQKITAIFEKCDEQNYNDEIIQNTINDSLEKYNQQTEKLETNKQFETHESCSQEIDQKLILTPQNPLFIHQKINLYSEETNFQYDLTSHLLTYQENDKDTQEYNEIEKNEQYSWKSYTQSTGDKNQSYEEEYQIELHSQSIQIQQILSQQEINYLRYQLYAQENMPLIYQQQIMLAVNFLQYQKQIIPEKQYNFKNNYSQIIRFQYLSDYVIFLPICNQCQNIYKEKIKNYFDLEDNMLIQCSYDINFEDIIKNRQILIEQQLENYSLDQIGQFEYQQEQLQELLIPIVSWISQLHHNPQYQGQNQIEITQNFSLCFFQTYTIVFDKNIQEDNLNYIVQMRQVKQDS